MRFLLSIILSLCLVQPAMAQSWFQRMFGTSIKQAVFTEEETPGRSAPPYLPAAYRVTPKLVTDRGAADCAPGKKSSYEGTRNKTASPTLTIGTTSSDFLCSSATPAFHSIRFFR